MELDGLTSDPTPLGEAAKAMITLVVDHVGSHADVLKVQTSHGDSPLTVRSSQINFDDPVSWECNILCYPDTSLVTCGPSPSPPLQHTHIGALRDLEPLQQSTLMDEDIHYWTHGDDEEDEDTVHAILAAEDPQEAMKQRLHCGGAYVEEILDD